MVVVVSNHPESDDSDVSFDDTIDVEVGTAVSFCAGFFPNEDPSIIFSAVVSDLSDSQIKMYCAADNTTITQSVMEFEKDVRNSRIFFEK